jgi:hypothetical protein
LIFLNARSAVWLFPPAMERDPDILAIARAAVAEFGASAAEVIDQRARRHVRAGERCGAELWRRVADAIRAMLKR